MHDPDTVPDPWTTVPITAVGSRVWGIARTTGRPVIIAIDGRSASGKTTVADQLASGMGGVPIIHTDDVAWHHSFFDWWPLLRDHLLLPLRSGRHVSWRPPGWDAHPRPGSIDIPAAPVIIVEGVSASRQELADLVDVAIWVDGDPVEQERRGILRDGGDAGAQRFWAEWQAEERPLLDRDRPWDRADLQVLGTPPAAPPPGAWRARPGPGGRLGHGRLST